MASDKASNPCMFDNSSTHCDYELICEYLYGNNVSNGSDEVIQPTAKKLPVHQMVMIISYICICMCGLVGNGLVIYVVLRFAKMKTVTNMYILNLAVSDVLFLISLPFLITTTVVEHWIFGGAMCKIYFVLFSINLFTGVFTLAVMSADRYLAVCHPIRSVQYRTTRMAFCVCVAIWLISLIVMLPIILYSTTVPNRFDPDKKTCTISWPDRQPIPGDKAFTWYTFLLGFLIPVSLIAVFYTSVILRLRRIGPRKISNARKKSNKKVTRMALAMFSFYVICWLPYWCFQVNLTFKLPYIDLPEWQIYMFSSFTVLSFANSFINPILYAFLSDVFRKSFMNAFNCSHLMYSSNPGADNNVFPRSPLKKVNNKNEKFELTSMVNQTENTSMPSSSQFQTSAPNTARCETNKNNKQQSARVNINCGHKEIQTKQVDQQEYDTLKAVVP